MAGQSQKKIKNQNNQLLNTLIWIHVFISCLYFVISFYQTNYSITQFPIKIFISIQSLSFFSLYFLNSISKSSQLNQDRIPSLLRDTLILLWTSLLLSLGFGSKSFILLIAIPVIAIYNVYITFLAPFLSKSPSKPQVRQSSYSDSFYTDFEYADQHNKSRSNRKTNRR